jgi:hypothetical protein
LIERWFPPSAATGAQPVVGSAEVPPLPRRKPEAISEVTLAGADPQLLVGLDFDATKALLGDPVARMEQPPAKVWSYTGGGCLFSVYFYPSVNDQGFRVLAYEVTDGADVLDLDWLGDPPGVTPEAASETPPEAPKILDRDDPVVRRCFAELLQQHEPNSG